MNKNVNGVTVIMNAAEIEQLRGEQTKEPTPDERIAALEEELKAAKILLGLED